MHRRFFLLAGVIATLSGCAIAPPTIDREQLIQEVTAREIAFAKTMADRDYIAFETFIADDAVFLNDGRPLRGKQSIVDHWRRFYTDPTAPFAWKPDLVEVSGTGGLAESIGPVSEPGGNIVARFYSTWRREPSGEWRIVFDNGYDVCK